MKTITYTTIDRAGWPSGEWDGEPDKVQWQDEATGLPCLAVRNRHSGNWCGYVGVSESTWCADRINDSDVEYVRAGTIAAAEPLTFDAAIRLARGSLDYGGGYWSTEERAIFHHGIKTVINVLENAAERGLSDSQTRAVYAMGATASPVKAEPTQQDAASLSYPTTDDTSDPVFVAIWQTIRGWNLERTRGAELAWANGMDAFAILQAVRASLSEAQQGEAGGPRCPNCDDTGDVHGIDGEWRGICHCPAGTRLRALYRQEKLAAPAQPAPGGEDQRDSERLDWLSLRNVEVRAPLGYGGSSLMFRAVVRDDVLESAGSQPSDLREQIDAAMSPPPTSATSRPFTEAEHAAWERENGVGEVAKGEGERR